MSELIDLIKNKQVYVNVRTSDFEDGEIRGQVYPSLKSIDVVAKKEGKIRFSENVPNIGQTYRLWIYVHNAVTVGKEVDFHTLLFNSKNKVFSDKVFDVEQTIRDFGNSLVPVDYYVLTNKKDQGPDQLRVCVHLSNAAGDTDVSHFAGPTLVEKDKYQVDFDYNVLLDDLR